MTAKLHTLLDTFHTAILTDNTALAPAIKANSRITPEQQMAIYIEGYRLRLNAAIRSDYPELLALLGDDMFDALALAYIEATAPMHFSLDHYPHAFASFVRAHANDPFAADVAEVESAIAQVFIMEESAPLEASALTGLAPEDFGAITLRLREASCLLRLHYDTDTYIANRREGHAPEIPEPKENFLFLVRHHNEVKRHPLSRAEYLILNKLGEGMPVGVALESTVEAHPEFLPEIAANLQQWFARWTSNGFFQSLTE